MTFNQKLDMVTVTLVLGILIALNRDVEKYWS